MLNNYFKRLYRRAMDNAYSLAHAEIINVLEKGGSCLDCGANRGNKYEKLHDQMGLENVSYYGIEWNAECVEIAKKNGINVIQGDLNQPLAYPDESFRCIFGLSVLEHLLNPCKYLKECFRCLEQDGTLIILTPNISTYFTVALLLFGKMPSTGPHPDSDALIGNEELFKLKGDHLQYDTESDTPVHRHLVVFSYKVLKRYLVMLGFREVKGYGFGLYPFPVIMQDFLERVDPYHCHQLVFIARK